MKTHAKNMSITKGNASLAYGSFTVFLSFEMRKAAQNFEKYEKVETKKNLVCLIK